MTKLLFVPPNFNPKNHHRQLKLYCNAILLEDNQQMHIAISAFIHSSALTFRMAPQIAADQMDHVAVRFWIKRRGKLIHDYSLTSYFLSPNPTIIAHAQ